MGWPIVPFAFETIDPNLEGYIDRTDVCSVLDDYEF